MSKLSFKLPTKLSALLAIITAIALVCLQSLGAKPVVSAMESATLSQPVVVATAAAAPSLVPAVLGGRPISVLYITRAGDTVLARCYPGYQPAMTVRAMGTDPNASTQREGVVTCQPAA